MTGAPRALRAHRELGAPAGRARGPPQERPARRRAPGRGGRVVRAVAGGVSKAAAGRVDAGLNVLFVAVWARSGILLVSSRNHQANLAKSTVPGSGLCPDTHTAPSAKWGIRRAGAAVTLALAADSSVVRVMEATTAQERPATIATKIGRNATNAARRFVTGA